MRSIKKMVYDRKKWRNKVMKGKSNPIGKQLYIYISSVYSPFSDGAGLPLS